MGVAGGVASAVGASHNRMQLRFWWTSCTAACGIAVLVHALSSSWLLPASLPSGTAASSNAAQTNFDAIEQIAADDQATNNIATKQTIYDNQLAM